MEAAAAVSSISVLGILARMRWNFARLPILPAVEAVPSSPAATVCLCIPARNEAREIGPALDSWLAQDHPSLVILVVDDGSTDETPALLAARAAAHPERLRVLRNDYLPPGWLGKNHALHLATQQPEARAAEWILFVDADVHATPDLLRRAFASLERNPADILGLLFAIDTEEPFEHLYGLFLVSAFLTLIPPHQVPDPKHWSFCAGGGFILVRRSAYDTAGGHAAAPLEPIDDMMLARRVKKAGFVNRVALGGPMLHLRMYHGLMEVVRGTRKSVAGAPGWLFLPLGALFSIALYLAPLWLLLAGQPWLALALLVMIPLLCTGVMRRITGGPMRASWLLWPLMGGIVGWAMMWAFCDASLGRNTWRGRTVKLRAT
ncbi:MAG: glycosyltransferase family A protein [Thermoanaerobaculia bacterium]